MERSHTCGFVPLPISGLHQKMSLLPEGKTSYPLCTLNKSRNGAAVIYELELHNRSVRAMSLPSIPFTEQLVPRHCRPDNRLTADFINDSVGLLMYSARDAIIDLLTGYTFLDPACFERCRT
jgi:hypothetical protein